MRPHSGLPLRLHAPALVEQSGERVSSMGAILSRSDTTTSATERHKEDLPACGGSGGSCAATGAGSFDSRRLHN